jgi:hypothetical protein
VEALILEKDGVMPRQGKYPDEVRERAVRMVLDHEHEYGSQWEAICSVAEKLGPKAQTCGCGSAELRPMRVAGQPRIVAAPGCAGLLGSRVRSFVLGRITSTQQNEAEFKPTG